MKHGHRRLGATSPTWLSWRAMNERCHTKGAADYPRYGGRGIRVCERWRRSFLTFLNDMGERAPDMTLERIDVNDDYTPLNCRWADALEQAANKRTNVYITYQGKTQHIRAWARELGLDRSTIAWRLKRGWTVEKTLSTPIMSRAERGILGLRSRGVI